MGKRGPKPKKKVFNLFTEVDEDIKRILLTILFFCLAIITILSVFQLAGMFGKFIAGMFLLLFGKGGYALVPISFLVLAWYYFHMRNEDVFYSKSTLIGISLILLAFLSILNTFFVNMFEVTVKGYTISIPVGGYLGYILYFFTALLGKTAGVLCLFGVMISGFLIAFQNILNLNHLPSLFGNIRTRRVDTIEEVEEGEDIDEEVKEIPTPSRKFKGKLEILNSGKKEEEVMDLLSGKFENYKLPSLNLLESDKGKPAIGDVRSNAQIIKDTFHNFGIEVEMREVCVGPTVTQYTLKPAQGVKLSKIEGLNKDLALALAAHPIRIEAPIPGKSLVGIEVPNEKVTMVRLRNLLSHSIYQQSDKSLLVALGRDVANEPIFINLAKQPHLLIAGSTGSGKSVAVQSIITSLLYRNSPESLRMIMVDPKKVELSFYEGIPHLLTPVITDCKKVLPALRWANTEMERRYNLLVENHCKDIESFNKKMKKEEKPILPNIVIIIDELAELMMRYGKDVEAAIVSLAQMARAVGVHLLISTQRPSVEVITGLIKANIPARVACQVMSQIDSRTILDGSGAEKLVGNGDMLYLDPASSKPKRIQGAFVSEDETKKITDFIRQQDIESTQSLDLNMEVSGEENGEINLDAFDSDDSDPLLQDAIDEVVKSRKASASYLQRRLKIGYSRAARILDILEEKGIIGPANGSKPREVYIDNDNE